MSELSWIVAASLAGGVLSALAAGGLALKLPQSWIPALISYAVGALLGAVFLKILPHALEHAQNVELLTAIILAGILLFFVLEKLVLWRHCHDEHCEAHDPAPPVRDHGQSGAMILIGDTVHNFVDGIIIAAAFIADTRLGIVTSLAIIAHEIPQEVGDFMILLHSGFSRRRALAFNVLSSCATLAGAVLAYFALMTVERWIPALLGIAVSAMLYVAVADLIPGLHRRPELGATAQQIALISLGIGTIWLAEHLFPHA
jgi:zinc and cadmium transporter